MTSAPPPPHVPFEQHNPQPPFAPHTAHDTHPRPSIPWGWSLGGAAVGLLVGAGLMGTIWGATHLSSSLPSAHAQQIEAALSTCAIESDGIFVNASDSFDSVTFDGVGLSYSGASFSDVDCFADEIGMPSHVDSEMGQTRALDGRQSAAWEGFAVSWSYHPDDGMNAVFSIAPS